MSRRERLGHTPDGADLLLRDGRVYVGAVRGRPQFAETLAVRDGRVLAAGSAAELAPLVRSTTAVVDLAGRTVIPGLIDSHVHLVRAGLTWTHEVRWFEIPTLKAALGLLHEATGRQPAGTWLRVVGGWHPGQFAEGRGPTTEELNRLFPDHPVYVQQLYEEAVLNAAGLTACGITAETDDPPLGTFLRDASGRPTGTVRGIGAFTYCLERMPDPNPVDKVIGTQQLLGALNAFGLTGAVDAGGIGMPPENYEPLFELWRAGDVTLRTRLFVGPGTRGGELEELTNWLRHTRPGFGDRWLRHVGLGEIILFGCHDLEGLSDFSVTEDSRRQLETVLRAAARRRWPIHMHAVLDSTTSAVLDVWERIAEEYPIGELRWSLAHVEPISGRNLDRVAALGIGIAVQDRMVYRARDSARVWGEATVRTGPPLRTMLDRGIPLAAGTDATRVASPNPWVSLWWMVTGKTFDGGPQRSAEQCLDRVEALDAYTAGSAWLTFEEQERGRLQPGAVADLAVLSDDYFTVADDDIRALRADLTVVDGRVVHAEGDFAGLG